MQNYDVAVIGGGPGGYVAAIRTASSGLKTALIEKDTLGGVCLNWGCIPTKSLLRNAEIIRLLNQGDIYGLELSGFKLDYAKAYARSRQVSAKLVKGIEYLMKKNKVTVFKDTGRLTGLNEVSLERLGQKLTAKNIIIATGASSAKLPFLDYTMTGVIDSKGALQLSSLPKSIVIIGAGAIGMEFATVFSAYGTEVCIVEAMECVLPNEDSDVSSLIKRIYEDKGVRVLTGASITSVLKTDRQICIDLTQNRKTMTLKTDSILSAVGIKPKSENLGLENCGVKLDEYGYIVTDNAMRTSAPGVYAIGDVTGKLALAHTASAQALTAAEHISTGKIIDICYENIPKCTYTDPETASVGLTEQVAKKAGYSAASAVFPFSANGKAVSYGDDSGFVKLVYDKKYGQLLGAHMVGAFVTEMIWGITGYLGMEMTIEEMAKIIHPHPTVSEAIMEAAHLAHGKAIHI